jgi:hypothetical protein
MISALSQSHFSSHLSSLGAADAPTGPAPLSNEIPAPTTGVHPAFPFLLVGAIALCTYLAVEAFNDTKSTSD